MNMNMNKLQRWMCTAQEEIIDIDAAHPATKSWQNEGES
jgi:hypothetical protein